jgi:prevent-host-death family protein
MYTLAMGRKKTYSVAEARASLPAILDEIGTGGEVTLTRRGRPAAVVVSTETYAALRRERPTFAQTYGEFLERHPVRAFDLEPGYFEGLRDRSSGRKVRL